MHKALEYMQDPGHGWLQVPKELILELGIVGDISLCSYVDEHFGYLEEDCDMPLFLHAVSKRSDITVDLVETYHEDGRVRFLPNWNPLAVEGGGEVSLYDNCIVCGSQLFVERNNPVCWTCRY